MPEHSWDPERYLTYADERGRPFVELLTRVAATEVDRAVDLGCGPGNLTRLLKERWPSADVVGVDSSPQMVARARETVAEVRFEVGDLREWQAEAPVDVLVSNATLQWVPDHLDLLQRLVGQVVPGGWLAFQVPGNFAEPSHVLLHELAADDRFRQYVEGVARPDAYGAEVYLEALLGLGCRVDAWETTYLHVLQGEDPVFTWVSGTGARPVLQALPGPVREEFETEYRRRLGEAYPSGPHGTVLPFRRVFAVAQVPAS
ncbi:MAG TPA: trans-aconitate 2-methyltransferase [Nocardioidaceae bacterium]|nr:trans-aconitate 2-methyltransferase [Nocardioidaceae bacterium]